MPVIRLMASLLGALAHLLGVLTAAVAIVGVRAGEDVAAGSLASAALFWCVAAGARSLDTAPVPHSAGAAVVALLTAVLEELARVGWALALFASVSALLADDGAGALRMLLLGGVARMAAGGWRLCRHAVTPLDVPWTAAASAFLLLLTPSGLLRAGGRFLLAVVASGLAWAAVLLFISGDASTALLLLVVSFGFSMVLKAATDGELQRMAGQLRPVAA